MANKSKQVSQELSKGKTAAKESRKEGQKQTSIVIWLIN